VLRGGEALSILRLFHYLPPRVGGANDGGKPVLGSSPHTDWGSLTVIQQDAAPRGLEFWEPRDARWVHVPPRAGSYVVNVGDYLSLLSNGTYHSPVHRVVHEEHERTSFVFFAYPNPAAVAVPYAGAAAKAEAEVAASGHASGPAYNTLVTRDGIDASFGDWLHEKWAGVKKDDAGQEAEGEDPNLEEAVA